jgi:hypothetical protein
MTIDSEGRKMVSFRLPKNQLGLLWTLVESGKFDNLTATIEKAVQDFIKTEPSLNPDTVVAVLPKRDYVELLKMDNGYAAEGVKGAIQQYIDNNGSKFHKDAEKLKKYENQ